MTRAERLLRDEQFARDYSAGLSLTEIGKRYGCSGNCVSARLIKMGVHKPKDVRKPGEIKELSPQIIIKYLCGETTRNISKSFRLNEEYVCKILKEAGISRKRLEIKHQAMRCYKSQGHTMQEVADMFSVGIGTAQQVCKGVAPQLSSGCFGPNRPPMNKGVINADDKVAPFINARIKSTLEYAGNYTGADGRADLRCKVCGEVFNRAMGSIRHGKVACPTCMAAEAKRRAQIKKAKAEERRAEAERLRIEREQIKAEKEAERERIRIERIHPCPVCGTITDRPKYCCTACANKAANKTKEHRRRERIKTQMVDKDITVEGLFRRDVGKCWLCGERCSFEDYTVRDGNFIVGDWYPSIDHVIPLVKGGKHSWANVRLAHHRCNSIKHDRII